MEKSAYRWHLQHHLPTSSYQRSYWMPPYSFAVKKLKVAKIWLFDFFFTDFQQNTPSVVFLWNYVFFVGSNIIILNLIVEILKWASLKNPFFKILKLSTPKINEIKVSNVNFWPKLISIHQRRNSTTELTLKLNYFKKQHSSSSFLFVCL